VVDWNRPGAAPYDPYTGSYYMYSGMADRSYKRLGTTLDLTGKADGALDFWTSYDTEPDWDYLFVEAHTVGQDDWQTLPITDDDGIVLTDSGTGESCSTDGDTWHNLHPHLAHYQTVTGPNSCDPTGTSGSWNALTGNSGGWEHVNVDLSSFAGKDIELFVSYVQDWGTSGLGVFIDDARIASGGQTLSSTSFEDADIAPWTVPGPPAGTESNSADWVRTTKAFDEASGIRTARSIWLTFGVEGLETDAQRQDVLSRSLKDLGVITAPTPTPTPTATPTPSGGGGKPAALGDVRVGRQRVRAEQSRRLTLKVWCPPTTDGTCRGVSRLSAGGVEIAGRSFAVVANRWQSIDMRLSSSALRKLKRRGKLSAMYTVLSRGSDGVLRTDNARITILAPSRR
jgi:hypothetical protein